MQGVILRGCMVLRPAPLRPRPAPYSHKTKKPRPEGRGSREEIQLLYPRSVVYVNLEIHLVL